MFIRFWGSRGSIPVSGKEYIKYGGDTACVEIHNKAGDIVIIDSGTGIRRLGKLLVKEKVKSCYMFFTHSHWDHIMGFPFFQPIYNKNFSLRLMGCPHAQHAVEEMVSKTMQPPNFPVRFEEVSAKFSFKKFCSLDMAVGSLKVEPIALSHPDSGTGFRFTEGGSSFVFLTDNELGHIHPGGLGFSDYVRFASGADILVHDAEFSDEEYKKRKTWGHSPYSMALNLALKAGVKKLGLYHHNQDRSDAAVDAIVKECRAKVKAANSKLEVFAVACDTEIKLP